MSVYSGFATRLQETNYDQLTSSLISLLIARVMALYRNEHIDEIAWISDFGKVYRRLVRLEEHKYQPPKVTLGCKELAEVLGTESTVSSHSASRQLVGKTGRVAWIRDVGETVIEELSEYGKGKEWGGRFAKTPQPERMQATSSPYLRSYSKEKKLKTLRPHFKDINLSPTRLRRNQKPHPVPCLLSH